jgi:hypothetical protein
MRFAMSAVPGSKALVNAGVWVVRGLAAGQLLLHAAHTGAEGVSSRPTFGLRTLQVTARSAVVRLPPELTEPASGIFVLGLEIEALLRHGYTRRLPTRRRIISPIRR